MHFWKNAQLISISLENKKNESAYACARQIPTNFLLSYLLKNRRDLNEL